MRNEYEGIRPPRQSDARAIAPRNAVPWTAYVLVVLAVVLLVVGFVSAENAIAQTAFFAAAAVVAILARIAQAGTYHDEMMDELRRR